MLLFCTSVENVCDVQLLMPYSSATAPEPSILSQLNIWAVVILRCSSSFVGEDLLLQIILVAKSRTSAHEHLVFRKFVPEKGEAL